MQTERARADEGSAFARTQRLVAAIWCGSAIFLMLASSAAFRAAGSRRVAADVVGAMLTRWHYIALLAPLVLLVVGRHFQRRVQLILFAAVLLAATQIFVDLRIRSIRMTSPVPVSELTPDDPVRRRFGALHGASMMLLALQAIAAAIAVMARSEKNEEEALSDTPVDDTIYKVVRNHEEQYSIWPAHRENPLGWDDAGFSGPKEACLRYIEEVWTDMRPLSLRKKMEEMANGGNDDTSGGGP